MGSNGLDPEVLADAGRLFIDAMLREVSSPSLSCILWEESSRCTSGEDG